MKGPAAIKKMRAPDVVYSNNVYDTLSPQGLVNIDQMKLEVWLLIGQEYSWNADQACTVGQNLPERVVFGRFEALKKAKELLRVEKFCDAKTKQLLEGLPTKPGDYVEWARGSVENSGMVEVSMRRVIGPHDEGF